MAKDETFMDKQTDLEEMFLSDIDDVYYDKCGYIHHTDQNRAKMVMAYPIKYNVRDENDIRSHHCQKMVIDGGT